MPDLISFIQVGPRGDPGTLQGSASGDIDLEGFALRGMMVAGFDQELNLGVSGAAKAVPLSAATKQRITINQDTVLTFSPVGAPVGSYQFRLIMDSTGGHTTTLAGLNSGRWLGAPAQPAINLAPLGETLLTIYFDGTNMTQSLAKIGAA